MPSGALVRAIADRRHSQRVVSRLGRSRDDLAFDRQAIIEQSRQAAGPVKIRLVGAVFDFTQPVEQIAADQ